MENCWDCGRGAAASPKVSTSIPVGAGSSPAPKNGKPEAIAERYGARRDFGLLGLNFGSSGAQALKVCLDFGVLGN